ncbi:hypothetical protein ABBQ38_011905 [Trebouxia sp. C0009 RCD-2024]
MEVLFVGKLEEPWYPANAIARACGYTNAHKAIAVHVSEANTRPLCQLLPAMQHKPLDLTHNKLSTKYINGKGVRALLARSRKAESIEIAKRFGIDTNDFKPVYPEMTCMAQIMAAFKGCQMQQQFSVGQYRIDLYYIDYKIAVECDEFGHRDRDVSREGSRQKFITFQLGCQWVRFDPHANSFSVFDVINAIFTYIHKL